MKTNAWTADDRLDDFAAELTEAAYPAMLRHGSVDNWLDMELELWKTLQGVVRKWDQEWPRSGVMLVQEGERGHYA